MGLVKSAPSMVCIHRAGEGQQTHEDCAPRYSRDFHGSLIALVIALLMALLMALAPQDAL